jgi:predicted NBD/HSP70 family sugar kinase
MIKRILTIIIGGTYTRAALASENTPITEELFFLQKPTTRSVEGLVRSVKEARELAPGGAPDAIIVGLPGKVADNGRRLRLPPVFGCTGEIDLYSEICSAVDDYVVVENDANLMAFGEYVNRDQQDACLVSLVVGTGIGCGIVVNGRVYRGANGGSGEVGYLLTECNGAFRTIRETCRRAKLLRDSAGSFTDGSSGVVPEWLQVYATATTVALSAIISMLAPNTIVLSGAVAESNYGTLLSAYNSVLARHELGVLKGSGENVNIIKSSLGHLSAIYGACALSRIAAEPGGMK